MNENEIEDGLRGVALTEPALGFDPDEVATRAARRLRNRRATIGTGLAVLGIAAATITVANNSTTGQSVPGGPGQSTDTSSASTTSTASSTTTDPLARLQAHVREVLPTVLPEAADINVGAFDDSKAGLATSVITFTDSAGPARFNLTVSGTTGGAIPLAERCGPDEADQGDGGLLPHRRPDGSRLRCDKIPQPGGGTLVLKETAAGAPVRVDALHATYYRSDGSTVGVWNDDSVPDRSAPFRSRFALTEQQLTALVTDPALVLP